MQQKQPLTRLVRPLPRGQITLPIEFRRRLRIDETTMLKLSLSGGKIEMTPMRLSEKREMREYSGAEIRRFIKEDRLDPKTAKKARRLLTGRS